MQMEVGKGIGHQGSGALLFVKVRNSANYTDVMPGDRSVTPPFSLRGSLSPSRTGRNLSTTFHHPLQPEVTMPAASEDRSTMDLLRGSRITAYSIGFISLVAGLVLLFRPDRELQIIAIILGFLFVVSGFSQVAEAVTTHRKGSYWGLLVIRGLINFGIGLALIFCTGATLTAIIWLVGLDFVITGLLAIIVSFMIDKDGGRGSLLIGFISAIGGIAIGTFVGIISGYFGGKLDGFLMRLVDVFLAIPSLFVIIVGAKILSALGGTGLQTVIIVFIVFGWMGTARLVRGQVLALREMEFIEAARALGVRPIRIAIRHVLPNAIGPVVVSFPFAVGGAIIGEAFISYLGFGVNPATPTWGNILSESSKFLQQGNWWWIGFPGLFIVLTSLSINMIGDTLRSALDPRGRK